MLRRLMIVTGVMLALLVVLAACGAADETPTPVNGGAPAEPTATPSPTSEPVDLDGTTWMLQTIDGEPVPADVDATLSFDNGQAGGSTGCNAYGASYELTDDGELTFDEIMQTEIYCEEPEGVMDVESAFTSALLDVKGFRVDHDRLILLDVEGRELLEFNRDDDTADLQLAGTAWTVATLNGEPLIEDTEITVEFEEGRVGGSAGCNTYGGDYRVYEDGELSIPEIVSTEMACPEPAGIMDQETEFLQALRDVTHYREANDVVELFDDTDDVRIVLQPADESSAATQ
jgi:heat shock protein HslJ